MSGTSFDRIAGLSSSVAIKAPCDYYTTANIALSGLAVQAGGSWAAPLTQNDNAPTRVLVKNQTNAVDNGIWNPGAGTWQRARDFDGARDVVQATLMHAYQNGTDTFFEVATANPIVIGTTALSIVGVQSSAIADILARLADPTSASNGAGMVVASQSITYLAGSIGAKYNELVSVKDSPYLAKGDNGVTDDSASIQAAINAKAHVVVPPGIYRCDTMIEVPADKTLQLMGGAYLVRFSANSASTNPVLWIKGSASSVFGAGQAASFIISQNRAPNGVVLIGHFSMAVSHASVDYCSLRDLNIIGKTPFGQTSGAADVALHIQNPQIGGLSSYFHNIRGIKVQDVNYGAWLHGWANGLTISEVQGYRTGDDTVNGGALFFDNGSLDNAISTAFHHLSPNSTTIKLQRLDNTGTPGGTLHETFATSYSGIVCEQGGASARGIVATDGSVLDSYFQVRHNVSGGNNLDIGFLRRNTFIGAGSYGDSTRSQRMRFLLAQVASSDLNITIEKSSFLQALAENTQYKLFDIATTNANSGGVFEVLFSETSGSSLEWSGGGTATYAWRRSTGGTVSAQCIRYNKGGTGGATGNLCIPVVSGSTITIAFARANNGTATTSGKVWFCVRMVGQPAEVTSANLVMYEDTTKTTVVATALTNPISI